MLQETHWDMPMNCLTPGKSLLTRSKQNKFSLNACNKPIYLAYGNGRDQETHSSFIEVYSEYVSSEMSWTD